MRGLIWQLRGVLRSGEVERELDEEHQFHIDMETERLVREGMPAAEARRRALVAFGGVERYQDEVREARWTRRPEEVLRDVRYACRSLARRPLFTVVAVGTLAAAIATATTFFSVVEAVLLRPLDVPEAHRLVSVQTTNAVGEATGSLSLPDYVEYQAGGAGRLELAAHHLSDIALGGEDGAAQAALGMDVSRNYFSVLRITPALGRFFVGDAADRPDAPAEAVLSHSLWRGRFGSDSAVVGRTLHVNGRPLTIVGVAPPDFHGAMLGARPSVFLPLGLHRRLHGREIDRRGRRWLRLFGRLEPGVAPGQAAAQLGLTARALAAEYDYHEDVEPRDVRLRGFSALPPSVRDVAGRFSLLLLAASTILLLIAAVNVGGMLLARASSRAREMAVRLAIGAGRARLVRQMVVEGLVLGTLATAGAVGLTLAATRLLAGLGPPGVPGFRLDLPMDARVLGFALAAAVAASTVFSLGPAWHASRSRVAGALRGGGGGGSRSRGRAALVASQVALTVILVVAAGLLLRTLQNALAVDHGFEPEGVVVAELNLRLNGYDEERGRVFYRTLLERLDGSPAIAAAALSTSIPLGGDWDQTLADVPGRAASDPERPVVGWSAVSPDYFRVLRMPLLAGGAPRDGAGPLPVVVNQALAEELWAGGNAVGRHFRLVPDDAVVAGVAPTGRYRSLAEEPRLFVWKPLDYAPHVYVQLRPPGGAGGEARPEQRAAALGELRRAVADLDPYVPVIGVRTLRAAMGQHLFFQRTAAGLIGVFALLGLLLCATGIFGLLAYTVEQRQREIGIRMAVGASAASVIRTVAGTGLRPVLAGLAVGLLGAAVVARLLEGLLYDVPPLDPFTFAVGAGVLLTVAAAAAWLPARRAARADPARVLNTE